MFRKVSTLLNPASLDVYGVKPAIQIQGEPKSYSGVGILSSCFVATFVIWATIINASELFEKKSPTITTANLPASTIYQTIEITPDTFDFTFGMFDITRNSFYINSSIYTVQAIFIGNTLDNTSYIPLDLEECSPAYIKNVADVTGPTWCISKNQTHNTKLNVKTKQSAYISITFKRCTNSTTCADPTVIDNKLRSSYCIRAYSDWKIDPFNYKEPLQRYYKADWNGILLTQTKMAYVSLTKTEFTSDNGLLIGNSVTTNIVTVEGIENDLVDMGPDRSFVVINIANSGNKGIYSRSYIRLQDVLAQIGGLCSLFIFVVSLLVKPYSKFKMYESFINKVFHVEFDQPGAATKTNLIDLENNNSFNKSPDEHRNNISLEEHSRVGLKNQYGQSRLESNPDISISRLDDPNIDHITPGKTKHTIDPHSYLKEEEIQRSRLQPYRPSPLVNNNPHSLQIMPARVEMSDMTSDPSPVQFGHSNTESRKDYTTQGTTSLPKLVRVEKTPGYWSCLKKNRITPLSANKKPKNLSVGYFEYLFSFLRPRSTQTIKAIGKGSKQIMLQLDFTMLFRKLIEIDRLKMCLMTPEQRTLFDSINKPTLNVALENNQSKKKLEEEIFGPGWNEETPPNLSKLNEAYWSLKKGGCQSVIDQNLVSIYDRNREVIESMFRR